MDRDLKNDNNTGLRGVLVLTKKKKQTEEKAKVVAAVWGREFIQFHAALRRTYDF